MSFKQVTAKLSPSEGEKFARIQEEKGLTISDTIKFLVRNYGKSPAPAVAGAKLETAIRMNARDEKYVLEVLELMYDRTGANHSHSLRQLAQREKDIYDGNAYILKPPAKIRETIEAEARPLIESGRVNSVTAFLIGKLRDLFLKTEKPKKKDSWFGI